MQAHEYVKGSLGAFPQGAELVAASLIQAQQLHSPHSAPLLDRLLQHHSEQHQAGQQAGSYQPSAAEKKELQSAVRRIWMQYRIGTIDETDHAAKHSAGHTPVAHSSSEAPDPCDGQAMRWEDCLVCLHDVTEYIANHGTIDRAVSEEGFGVRLAAEEGEVEGIAFNVNKDKRHKAQALLSLSMARLAAKCEHNGAHMGYVLYGDFAAALSKLLLSESKL